jgi:hypothetical protein
MSLTEIPEGEKDRSKDERAAAFFREVLVPIALRERGSGRAFFAPRPDAATQSYYVEPTRRDMRPEDFELQACDSAEAFVRELAAVWSSAGREDLAAMAPRLAALATAMRESEEWTGDVSPFTYTMF